MSGGNVWAYFLEVSPLPATARTNEYSHLEHPSISNLLLCIKSTRCSQRREASVVYYTHSLDLHAFQAPGKLSVSGNFLHFCQKTFVPQNVNIHNFHKFMFNGYQHALKLKQNSQPTKILFGKIQPILWKKWTMMMMMMKDRICR